MLTLLILDMPMSTKFVKLELSEKKKPLPKDGDIVLISMIQIEEK